MYPIEDPHIGKDGLPELRSSGIFTDFRRLRFRQ